MVCTVQTWYIPGECVHTAGTVCIATGYKLLCTSYHWGTLKGPHRVQSEGGAERGSDVSIPNSPLVCTCVCVDLPFQKVQPIVNDIQCPQGRLFDVRWESLLIVKCELLPIL